jgi:hypothetical protein
MGGEKLESHCSTFYQMTTTPAQIVPKVPCNETMTLRADNMTIGRMQ